MQNCPFRFGPQYVPNSSGDILSPGQLTGGVLNGGNFGTGIYVSTFILLRHIRVVNSSSSPAAVSLWIGASGSTVGGTEFAWAGYVVPAKSYVDFYTPGVRLDIGEYLVGFSSDSNVLTIEGSGEIGIV